MDNSSKGETYSIINPSTGKTFVKCQKCDVEDTRKAIDAARDAFDNGPWPEMPLDERIKIFYKAADMMAKKSWELSKLDAMCNGIPVLTHLTMALSAIPIYKYICTQAKNVLKPKRVSTLYPVNSTVLREPDGVTSLIAPWNGPIWISSAKLAPALIAGNTVVFKPASQTPLTILEMTKIFEKAGLPKGVLNVITGPGSVVGTEMAKNEKVDHISLTGETITGKDVVKNASGNLKKVSLELGGKSANVIFDDFPIDDAVDMAAVGGYFFNGQLCIENTRILIHEKIHEKFAKKFAEMSKSLKLGNALSLTTNIGPLLSEAQMKRNLKYIESGKEEGATLLCRGYRPQEGELKNGFFVAPTVFDNVSNDMKIAQEEIFGPILSIIPFSTEEEAINIANDTIYGLGGAVMTRDRDRGM